MNQINYIYIINLIKANIFSSDVWVEIYLYAPYYCLTFDITKVCVAFIILNLHVSLGFMF